eukprot:3059041-Rhodomonas_salina.1
MKLSTAVDVSSLVSALFRVSACLLEVLMWQPRGACMQTHPRSDPVVWRNQVFALNHMNARAFAHLYIVGWLWSVFYIKSKNLMVPILIHMVANRSPFHSSCPPTDSFHSFSRCDRGSLLVCSVGFAVPALGLHAGSLSRPCVGLSCKSDVACIAALTVCVPQMWNGRTFMAPI